MRFDSQHIGFILRWQKDTAVSSIEFANIMAILPTYAAVIGDNFVDSLAMLLKHCTLFQQLRTNTTNQRRK